MLIFKIIHPPENNDREEAFAKNIFNQLCTVLKERTAPDEEGNYLLNLPAEQTLTRMTSALTVTYSFSRQERPVMCFGRAFCIDEDALSEDYKNKTGQRRGRKPVSALQTFLFEPGPAFIRGMQEAARAETKGDLYIRVERNSLSQGEIQYYRRPDESK